MDVREISSIAEMQPKKGNNRNTSLLRVGVIFLAVVSFFTTANGMRTYIFMENGGVAYAASAAIQSILLALSMNLPKYLEGIWNARGKTAESVAEEYQLNTPKINQETDTKQVRLRNGEHYSVSTLIRLLLCVIVIVLTFVTILISSWFSYVYIADVIHRDSWELDSELLVQQTYRAELYNARDYAQSYRTYLEESVGQDILMLDQQAQKIEHSNTNVAVDWDTESEIYTADGGAAASYMSPAIVAMKNVGESNSQESRELAATAIADAKENISGRIETVQRNLDRININLANYNSRIADLTNRINRATEETDTATLTAAINDYTQLINSATQQQIELQRESIQLDRALLRLPFYESILGLSNSTSSISIQSRLLQMQAEFFKQNPDEAVLLETATNIFEDLRSAASAVTEGENSSSTDEFSYTNLLIQMNRLIRNLTDYSEIKAIEINLDQLIMDLRTTSENVSENNSEQPPVSVEIGTEGTSPSSSSEQPEAESILTEQDEEQTAVETTSTEQNDEQIATEATSISQNEKSTTTDENAGEQDATQKETDSSAWKEDWRIRLEELKAQISAMPTYSETGESETGSVRVLTESQAEILRKYNRNASSAALDNMIRLYISDHNAIYQGIIYLTSPYKMLAIFALCLAFSFDVSGFVFGFVMQGEVSQKQEAISTESFADVDSEASVHKFRNESSRVNWTILEHLQQYRILTGNFIFKDGTYHYKAFRDGLPEELAVKATANSLPYQGGIYILLNSVDGEGNGLKKVGEDANLEYRVEQELSYAGQLDGPRDGVFENCELFYQEGGLYRKNSEESHFVCSMEEQVPVHCYDSTARENRSFPVKKIAEMPKFKIKTAVVALNKKGTRVSAVYIIKDT